LFGLAVALLLFLSPISFVPRHSAQAQGQSQLTVISQDTKNNALVGMYAVLYDGSGNVVATGYTPAAFTLNDGVGYVVQVDDYGSCSFNHWADTGGQTPSRSISIASNTQITAVYGCGVASSSSVTVSSIDQNGGTAPGFYTRLYDSSGKLVADGYTPKTFSTTSGTTYGIAVEGYGTCAFTRWSDGVVSDPRSFTATSGALSFTAVMTCLISTTTTVSYTHLTLPTICSV